MSRAVPAMGGVGMADGSRFTHRLEPRDWSWFGCAVSMIRVGHRLVRDRRDELRMEGERYGEPSRHSIDGASLAPRWVWGQSGGGGSQSRAGLQRGGGGMAPSGSAAGS